jgi:hypothetical protein
MAIRFDVFKQHCLLIIAAILMAIMSGLPSQSYAGSPEQRCTGLGANCLCSEPLNTTTYSLVPPTSYGYSAGDSTTKKCNLGPAGAVFHRNTNDAFGTKDPVILGKLPAAHTNTYVLRGAEGHTGIWDLGSQFKDTDPRGRRSVRYYQYFSPDFAMSGGGCSNSGKMNKWDDGPYLSYNGKFQPNIWTGWSVAPLSCCWRAPGQSAAFEALSWPSNFVGKWWRIEMVATNIGGIPMALRQYWKNVTDNGPEYTVFDTSVPTAQVVDGQWTIVHATTLTKPSLNRARLEWFRNGTCPGFLAVSHILYAAWSTDAGQRIGAALEIEGGTTRPAPPGSVTVR